MNNKILSICIPTWNMADRLELTLNSIIPQALEYQNEIEICISNNGSSDNTEEIVMAIKEKYPSLEIKYHKNDKNLGLDRNLMMVTALAEGIFVWLFGDDEIVDNGLKDVIKFVRKINQDEIGLIVVGRKSYCINKQNQSHNFSYSTIYENKSEIFELNADDIITYKFKDAAFISALLLNNIYLKKVFQEDGITIENSIGTIYSHMVWYSLIFMKYPFLKGLVLNKIVVLQEMNTKFKIERMVKNSAGSQNAKKILRYTKYSNKYQHLLSNKTPFIDVHGLLLGMLKLKAFEKFNYTSLTGVIKLFYDNFQISSATAYSSVFLILLITPSKLLKNILRFSFRIKNPKHYPQNWVEATYAYECVGDLESGGYEAE